MGTRAVTKLVVQEAVRRLREDGERAPKTALARRLGVTRSAINQWEEVPPRHVLELESLSGVPRYEMRPDIYGAPPSAADHKAA
jgi:transcriptional regulator with XRE-family HTH domain